MLDTHAGKFRHERNCKRCSYGLLLDTKKHTMGGFEFPKCWRQLKSKYMNKGGNTYDLFRSYG